MEIGEERAPVGRRAKRNQCGEKYLHKPLDRLEVVAAYLDLLLHGELDDEMST
jgi:hypothetical protein